MALELIPSSKAQASGEVVRARWARLAEDFSRLQVIAHVDAASDSPGVADQRHAIRDVGELLLRGHDEALADAERHVVLDHTVRTGHVVDFDDIDDDDALDRWARELDRASAEGWAPPAPAGFWASFLRWRTPLGMARLTDRRSRSSAPRLGTAARV